MEKILFYVNGHAGAEANLETAAAMARNSGAALTLVDVIDKLPREFLRLRPSIGMDSLEHLAAEEAYGALESLAQRARDLGAVAGAKVLVGVPSMVLLREVQSGGYDMLAVSAHRRASLRERVFGGAAQQLMRACPCPVLVIRPQAGEPAGEVLAAVAPESGDPARTAASVAILEAAVALARMQNCALRIVHCWALAGEGVLLRTAGIHRAQLAALLSAAHRSARAAVADLLRRVDLGGVKYSVSLRKGDPLKVVAELADTRRVNVLVLGAPRRSTVAGFLAGSLADELFWGVGCPVATVNNNNLTAPGVSRAA